MFQDTRKPLKMWFRAMWYVTSQKNGASALGLLEPQPLAYYLDEFTFRFNRRNCKSRGKLFYRLMQQAVATAPTTYAAMVATSKQPSRGPQRVGAT